MSIWAVGWVERLRNPTAPDAALRWVSQVQCSTQPTGLRCLWATILALLLVTPPAQAAVITPELRAKILAHGPWPLTTRPDPSNRVSGKPAAIAFGRALFSDDGLSRFGALSCARCHKPDLAWGDGRAKASAAASLDRNTPALYNLRHMTWFGWDGGADSLWMQSIRPILDPREMAASPEHVRDHIAATPSHAKTYTRVFGKVPRREKPERILANVGKALAAFQETITTGPTPFDAFRDALARNDATVMERYPEKARRGLILFVGTAGCSTCHAGPMFTNTSFHDTGVPQAAGRPDHGRHGGIEKLISSPFRRAGPHADGQTRHANRALPGAPAEHDRGRFRVPPLRNVALTGPYMHNGAKPTLADAVRHYADLDPSKLQPDTARFLGKASLSATDQSDLVAFLESLTAK